MPESEGPNPVVPFDGHGRGPDVKQAPPPIGKRRQGQGSSVNPVGIVPAGAAPTYGLEDTLRSLEELRGVIVAGQKEGDPALESRPQGIPDLLAGIVPTPGHHRVMPIRHHPRIPVGRQDGIDPCQLAGGGGPGPIDLVRVQRQEADRVS